MPLKQISDARRTVILTTRILIYLLLFLAFALAPETKATQLKLPFQEGERLSFDIYWGFLKVGETVMQVLPNTIVNGQTVRHFRLATRTTPLIDLIYKVRSEIEAFTDLEMNRSVLYKKNHREGGIHRNVVVTFDWEKNKAAYVSFGRQEQETDILPGTFDPLGILFYSRTQNYSATDRFERPVTDGKKCVMGRGFLQKEERIKIRGLFFDTYVIQPEMLGIEGLFEENQDARFTLWLTSDHTRKPVKIKIEVFIGNIVCELTSPSG
ncbi:MAG: DUF3108 domain-containing protein [Desulfobacterales bacterium]